MRWQERRGESEQSTAESAGEAQHTKGSGTQGHREGAQRRGKRVQCLDTEQLPPLVLCGSIVLSAFHPCVPSLPSPPSVLV